MPAPGFVAPTTATITGLVLAGGRGQRMGGADKGLQLLRGQPLIDHVLARLAPQAGELMISANRHASDYATRGHRVLADASDAFDGPLAGILAGLRAARTPWLAVAPCDAPLLPDDLVERLARAVTPEHAGAVVRRRRGTDEPRIEPVCCLLATALADDLQAYLDAGGRKVGAWVATHAAAVDFDRPGDADAFANFNTLAALER
jgi:molybdopterin-guanine dinucleotide biosynthesis protein A